MVDKMQIKTLIIAVSLFFSQTVSANNEGIDLFDKIQSGLTDPSIDYVGAIEVLTELNAHDGVFDPNGGLNIKFPEPVKKDIEKKVDAYLAYIKQSIKQVEVYLIDNKISDTKCTQEINDFKKYKLPIHTRDLTEFKKLSVRTREERELAHAETMVFTLGGPSISYMPLVLGTFFGCLIPLDIDGMFIVN